MDVRREPLLKPKEDSYVEKAVQLQLLPFCDPAGKELGKEIPELHSLAVLWCPVFFYS